MKFNGRGSLAAQTRNNKSTSMRCDADIFENAPVMCSPKAVATADFLAFPGCVGTTRTSGRNASALVKPGYISPPLLLPAAAVVAATGGRDRGAPTAPTDGGEAAVAAAGLPDGVDDAEPWLCFDNFNALLLAVRVSKIDARPAPAVGVIAAAAVVGVVGAMVVDAWCHDGRKVSGESNESDCPEVGANDGDTAEEADERSPIDNSVGTRRDKFGGGREEDKSSAGPPSGGAADVAKTCATADKGGVLVNRCSDKRVAAGTCQSKKNKQKTCVVKL
jgi:hypothetical protein